MTLTDECIAALPRVEKGLPRDIFAPIPTNPGPYSLDLVLEYSRFSTLPSGIASKPAAAAAAAAAGNNRQSATQQQRAQTSPQQQQQQQQQKEANADGKFNCTPCKKSFGSAATWNSHQMSAKHISAVKDAEKKNKSGSSGGSKGQGGAGQKGGSNNNNAKGRQQKSHDTAAEDQDPPEVIEALMSFRKVEKIVKENPSMAATVLWKIAKALWSFRQSQETANVLALLISILTELQVDPPSTPGSLSPTQIGMTLYLSRLSMARLIVYHSRSLAFRYYLDAIQGRWQIDPNDFQSLCEMVHTASAVRHLQQCKEYLSAHAKTEKLMAPPPSAPAQPIATEAPVKKPDPNLKLLTVLKESASMLSQTSSGVISPVSKDSTIDNHVLGETAVTLFSMVAALSEASGDTAGTVDALRSMAVIYHKGLRLTYSAAACLIRSAEIVFSMTTSGEQDKEKQGEEGTWDLFQALLLAMETGDFVRMRRAIGMLETCDILTFQDVKTVIEVAQAVISQDNDFLRNSAANSVEYLLLLLQEQNEAARSELLMCRWTTVDASMAALERVKRLVL